MCFPVKLVPRIQKYDLDLSGEYYKTPYLLLVTFICWFAFKYSVLCTPGWSQIPCVAKAVFEPLILLPPPNSEN